MKKIAKCSPGFRLQFALIFIIKLSKTRVYGHFSGAHMFKKIAIFESTMKRTSAVHTYLQVCVKVHEYIYRCDMPVLYMFPPEVFLLSVLPETLNDL